MDIRRKRQHMLDKTVSDLMSTGPERLKALAMPGNSRIWCNCKRNTLRKIRSEQKNSLQFQANTGSSFSCIPLPFD